MKKHKLTTNKKRALLLAGALILVVGGYFLYQNNHRSKVAEPAATPINPINYGPPTEQEKADSEARKKAQQEAAENPKPSSTTGDGKTAVTPVITSGSTSLQVSAYVPGVIEDGGTCTATFTKTGQTVSKTSAGVANVSDTNCPIMIFDRSQFPNSGEWQLTVAYSSGSASGTSAAKTVTIQ